MMSPLTRRAFGQVAAGSLVIGDTTHPARARTPGAAPEGDRGSTILDRLDALAPQTTFDILNASRLRPDSVIALTTNARSALWAGNVDYGQPCTEGLIGFVELLQDPEGEPFLGGFLVYSSAAAAVAASECTISGTAALGVMCERIRLAGLESAMLFDGDDQVTAVLTLARYVVILVSSEDLGAAVTGYEAQLTVLQFALNLIKHLDFALKRSGSP